MLSWYSASCWSVTNATTRSTSWSEIKAPWIRIGLFSPIGKKSISPRPNSFSAPLVSIMVRESVPLETAKAIREGTFALMIPVMTSTLGRCVAKIIWIPAARAIWAKRIIASSTSLLATIIKSANSSTMTTINGRIGRFSPSSAFFCWISWL